MALAREPQRAQLWCVEVFIFPTTYSYLIPWIAYVRYARARTIMGDRAASVVSIWYAPLSALATRCDSVLVSACARIVRRLSLRLRVLSSRHCSLLSLSFPAVSGKVLYGSGHSSMGSCL